MIEQLENCVKYFNEIFFKEIAQDLNCWVAGGALRDYFTHGYVTSDVDIYFLNQEMFDRLNGYFSKIKELKPYFENDKVVKYIFNGKKFDLVKVFFNGPQDTIANFDFTVCCCAVNRIDVYYHETFFMDLAKKRLVINKLPYPMSTLRRLQKYITRGYRICNGGILKLGEAIHNEPLGEQNMEGLYVD